MFDIIYTIIQTQTTIMVSYFISVTDDSNRQVTLNIAHIKYYFAEKHYGKDVTSIVFDKDTLRVLQSPEMLADMINAAQQA